MNRIWVAVTLATWAWQTGLAEDLGPCWRGQSGSTYAEWRFDSNTNPTSPNPSANVSGEALIAPGEFSSGWQQQVPGLGAVTGYWDLGRRGTIILPLSSAANRSVTAFQDIWVRVVQYKDSGIYRENTLVEIPGATLLRRFEEPVAAASIGTWMADQSVWRMAPATYADTVVIQGATNGSVIDRIIVETQVYEPTFFSNIVVNVDPGQCSRSNVGWALPAADNCRVKNVACTPPIGSTFPLGTTEVRCVMTDAYDQAATCQFTVKVEDTEPLRVSIRRASLINNSVEISWPVGCGESLLEWNANVTDAQGWTPVQSVPEVVVNHYRVEIEASDRMRWFRLKQP
jgi:hypothetical protein